MLALNGYYSSLADMIVGNDWDIPSPIAGATAKTKYY